MKKKTVARQFAQGCVGRSAMWATEREVTIFVQRPMMQDTFYVRLSKEGFVCAAVGRVGKVPFFVQCGFQKGLRFLCKRERRSFSAVCRRVLAFASDHSIFIWITAEMPLTVSRRNSTSW